MTKTFERKSIKSGLENHKICSGLLYFVFSKLWQKADITPNWKVAV